MHFYYDPILGLQYMTFEDASLMIYDVEPTLTKEEWKARAKMCLELIKELGILFIDSSPKTYLEYQPTITTNHNLDEILFRYGVH